MEVPKYVELKKIYGSIEEQCEIIQILVEIDRIGTKIKKEMEGGKLSSLPGGPIPGPLLVNLLLAILVLTKNMKLSNGKLKEQIYVLRTIKGNYTKRISTL